MEFRIVLIVGNGLAISFWKANASTLAAWHPSKPLSFEVPTPGNEAQPLLDNLPRFKAAPNYVRQALKGSDFELLRAVLAYARDGRHLINRPEESERDFHKFVESEARHFLALAYSNFDLQMRQMQTRAWPWISWFLKYRAAALHVISFNYDLLAELAMVACGRIVQPHCGIGDNRTVVFKPHGSVNFELPNFVVGFHRAYPIKNLVAWNDCSSIGILGADNLLRPRGEPVIVLPNEPSGYVGALWTRPAFDEYRMVAPQATHVIIVGLSYAEADRPEIDYFLNHIPATAQVYVVDPYPSILLLDAIKSRGHTPIVSDSPPDLAETGLGAEQA